MLLLFREYSGMKISVVTIVYNDVTHIERTLKNVIGQTAFDKIEYIVVDGASDDGTSEIISRYQHQLARYICEPDSGIYNAMNKGIYAATGEYLIFINSGDKFSSKDTVEKIIDCIGNGCPDVVYGHYREVSDGESNSKVIPCRNSDKIWYGPVASHQSTLYRLEHFRNNGLRYDETYKIAADYKLTAQAIKTARNILKTDVCISDFDISGVSSTNQNLGLKEANRVRREIFGWNKFRILVLSVFLICARLTKRYCNPIYKILRH